MAQIIPRQRLSGQNFPSRTRDAELDYQEVARVAYELFLKRGGQHGHDFDDWLNAEALTRANGTTPRTR